MSNLLSLEEGVGNIKNLIESAVQEKGVEGKKSAINSSRPINILHDVVKSELIRKGVNPDLINPRLGQFKGEKTLAGFLKFKQQDICVFPNNLDPEEETLEFKGLHTGSKDPLGELFTEHILTINVRSQLSSLGKNVDTMFERTYAEPINLHRRLPKMVLGEVYLIALRELDSNAIKNYRVVDKDFTETSAKYLEKYINGFAALNLRNNQRDDDFKYERVALIIADFAQNPVKIYRTTDELNNDGLLTEDSRASMDHLSFDGFIDRLLSVYVRRFGSGILS